MQFFERHQEWVAALTAGLVSGFAFATTWNSATTKDFWDIATAVGTVGAVLVALGIAFAGNFQRRRDAIELANLAAAKVSVTVEQSMKFSGFASAWADEAHDHRMVESYESLKTTLEAAQIHIENSDLLALAPLPSRCAHRLARATAILSAVRREVALHEPYFDRGNPQFNTFQLHRSMSFSSWRGQLSDARKLLMVVSQVCAVASHVSAPPSDNIEMQRFSV